MSAKEPKSKNKTKKVGKPPPSAASEKEHKEVKPIKYHYSIKMTSAHSANNAASSAASHKESSTTEFAKEEAAVKEAELIKESDVEHIKYAKTKEAEIDKASQACPDGTCTTQDKGRTVNPTKPFLKNLVAKIKLMSLQSIYSGARQTFTLKNMHLCAAAALSWIDTCISFITTSSAAGRNAAMQKARMPILFGMWVCIFTFVIGGIWSGFAPIDSVSHATGIVVSTSKKQIIQQRDGGILKEIYIKEGERVTKGQKLAQLEDLHTRAELESINVQITGLEKQLEVAQERSKSFKELEAKGFVSRSDLLNEEIRLSEVQSNLSRIKARALQLEEILDRSIVKSPVDGVVTQMDVHTIGATISPGQALMSIAPTQEDMIIEAYISSQDIEAVHVGLKAKVRIMAFKHRSVGAMDGIVTYVSPDTVDLPLGATHQNRMSAEYKLLHGQGHLSIYKVIVSIDKAQLKEISKHKDYELAPGMAADIAIVTGERTMIQYLLDPITSSFWNAFSEK
jgi:multidrug efflux pump subunit AcrA (membrane-fusion protein)